MWLVENRTNLDGMESPSLLKFDSDNGDWRAIDGLRQNFPEKCQITHGAGGLLVIDGSGTQAPSWLTLDETGITEFRLAELPDGFRPGLGAAGRGSIFVIGQTSNPSSRLLQTDIPNGTTPTVWIDRGELPAGVVSAAAATVQWDGDRTRLYVVTHIDAKDPQSSPVLYSFEPGRNEWTDHGPVPGDRPIKLMAAVGIFNLYAATAATDAENKAQWLIFNTATESWVGPIDLPLPGTPRAVSVDKTRIVSLYEDNVGTPCG